MSEDKENLTVTDSDQSTCGGNSKSTFSDTGPVVDSTCHCESCENPRGISLIWFKYTMKDIKYCIKHKLADLFFNLFVFFSGAKSSSMYKWAEREFKLSENHHNEDGSLDSIATDAMKLFAVVDYISDTSYSTIATVSLVLDLTKFRPITPLTGNDDEWMEVSEGIFQNRRCPHIFKNKDLFEGKAYNSEAIVFREPDGCCYTSVNSRGIVEFPYIVQPPEYVDVPFSCDEDQKDRNNTDAESGASDE